MYMVSFKMIDIVDVASDQMEPSKRVSLKEEEPANLVTSLREKLDSLSSLSSQSWIYRIPCLSECILNTLAFEFVFHIG